MSGSPAPLPCPFCGSVDISDGEVLGAESDGGTYTQSECQGCSALGPAGFLEPGEIDYGDVKAIAAWNRRAASQEAPPSALPDASGHQTESDAAAALRAVIARLRAALRRIADEDPGGLYGNLALDALELP